MVCDVNIEFCHIYADEHICEDHIQSISALQDIAKLNKKEGKTFVTSILIDDYNATKSIWEINTLERELDEMNALPDILAYESSCIDGANFILNKLPKHLLCTERFRREGKEVLFLLHEGRRIALKSTQNSKTRYTCGLLGAAWHGSKIGLVGNPFIDDKVAHTAITILPKRFMGVEENMKAILSYLDADIFNRLHNVYLS